METTFDDMLIDELNLYELLYKLTCESEFNKTQIYQRQLVLTRIEELNKLKNKYFKKISLNSFQQDLVNKIKIVILKILELDNINHTKTYQSILDLEQQKLKLDNRLRSLQMKSRPDSVGKRIDHAV